ncbi:hypothetical protein GGE65_008182 [Skermanella aerolata]|uniref:hypothetical protein n=1 Tax=Skermanella aerolata TaxID=393310 RepID=UPI003D1B1A0A
MSIQQRYDELRARVFQAEVGDEATAEELAELLSLDERLKEQAQIRSDAQRKFEADLHGASRIAYALRKGR